MSDEREHVAEFVARCVALRESEGDVSIEAVCAEHPHLAEAVRRRLDVLTSMGMLNDEETPQRGRRLGPFELLGSLGGGGMGEVHLARQDGLERHVALKIVRPDHLHFSGARERFAREAEAIAQLKHPGIVPVYTVGEDGGVPYLAMECVEGATLEEILTSVSGRDPATLSGRDIERAVEACVERLDLARGTTRTSWSSEGRGRALFTASWVEAVLRLGVAVTDALQHAHDRGILHRDVKPSNLMLTLDGRVLLLDFGLALRDGSARMTRTGAVVGSLTYMAPELIRGEEADARADVYGLGVTLFEMLALRAPFIGNDYDTTRAAILAGGPPSVRSTNPSVGQDAATLLGIALAAQQADRYPSAAALGADLQRVLERRPLLAKPPSAALRTWRWVQRRPAFAAACALACVLAIGGPITYAMLAQRHADEMSDIAREAKDAAQRADEESLRATAAMRATERHFALAKHAIDDLLVEVGRVDLKDHPRMLAVRHSIIDRAITAYDTLIEARPDDVDLRFERLSILNNAAVLLLNMGESSEALERYQQSLDLSTAELALVTPGLAPRALVRQHIKTILAIAMARIARGELDRGNELLVEALARLELATETFPDDRDLLTDLAEARGYWADQLAMLGNEDAADAEYERALELLDALLTGVRDDARALHVRTWIGQSWVTHLSELQRLEACVDAGLETLTFADRLEELGRTTVADRTARHAVWAHMGRSLSRLGAASEAESMLAAARAAARALSEEHRDDAHIVTTYLNSLDFSAAHARRVGRPTDELEFYIELELASRQAHEAAPTLVAPAISQALAALGQARAQRSLHAPEAALVAAQRAVELCRALEGRVERATWTERMRDFFDVLGRVHDDLGDHAATIRAAEAMASVDPESATATSLRRAAFLMCCALEDLSRDTRLGADERDTRRRATIDRCITLLTQAARLSPVPPASFRVDPRWSPILDHPHFPAIETAFALP